MNFVNQLCIGLVAMVPIGTWASNQSMQLEYEAPAMVLATPPHPPNTLWERFEFSFEQRAEIVFNDQFHSINTMQWHLELANRGIEDLREHTANVATHALSRSVLTGAREAAFDLPIMVWLEGQRNFWTDLLLHSLDTVEEESVAPLDPSYRQLERSWWKRLSQSRDFYYGLRPFRTSPYAFVSAAIRNGDSLLVLADLRYHYSNLADHQFEFALSVPLAHGFSIDVGTAYKFGRHAEVKQMVVKLFKQFRGGGIVHLGMEVQSRPSYLVGMSLPL